MPSDINGWPYAVPTDAVADYPATSQALAQALSDGVCKFLTGYATVTLSNSDNGFTQVDITGGNFSEAPVVLAISTNFSYYCYRAASGTTSATTYPIGVRHYQATASSNTVGFNFIAIGV